MVEAFERRVILAIKAAVWQLSWCARRSVRRWKWEVGSWQKEGWRREVVLYGMGNHGKS